MKKASKRAPRRAAPSDNSNAKVERMDKPAAPAVPAPATPATPPAKK